MTQLKNLNCVKTQKTQFVTNLEISEISIYKGKKTFKGSFSKNILTLWQPMRCSLGLGFFGGDGGGSQYIFFFVGGHFFKVYF